MAKKKCKCKKHGKKDCPKCFQFGTYYIVGLEPEQMTKRMVKMICHLTETGRNVYQFASGKPGGCPPQGCA
jgi:hypothetical protein